MPIAQCHLGCWGLWLYNNCTTIQAFFICIIFQAPSVTDCQQFTYKLWTIQTLQWSVHDQLSSLANTIHISYTFFTLIAMCDLKSSTEGKGDISAERTLGVACAVNLTRGFGVTASDNSSHDLPVSKCTCHIYIRNQVLSGSISDKHRSELQKGYCFRIHYPLAPDRHVIPQFLPKPRGRGEGRWQLRVCSSFFYISSTHARLPPLPRPLVLPPTHGTLLLPQMTHWLWK